MQDFLWRAARWLFAAVILVAAIYFFYNSVVQLRISAADPRLPAAFRASEAVFWAWFFVLAAVATGSAWWTIHGVLAWRGTVVQTTEEDPELAGAWAEVVERLAPGPRTCVYLALAPAEDDVAALLAAARLRPEGVAPAAEGETPLRAYATEKGLVVWCGGRPGQTAAFVCRALRALSPERPGLRGVMAVVPIDAIGPRDAAAAPRAARSSSHRLGDARANEIATGYRAALRAAASQMDTRCPLVVVVRGMQDVPGFLEYARRLPGDARETDRFGFSLKGDNRSRAALAALHARRRRDHEKKIRRLMADEPLQVDGNTQLFMLINRLEQAEAPVLHILEVLSDESGDDPIDLTGCYYAADGPDHERRAFAPAVLQGVVMGDPDSARWSRLALEHDRRRWRQALSLLVGGAAVVAAAWLGILLTVGPPGLVSWLLLALTAAAALWTLWTWRAAAAAS